MHLVNIAFHFAEEQYLWISPQTSSSLSKEALSYLSLHCSYGDTWESTQQSFRNCLVAHILTLYYLSFKLFIQPLKHLQMGCMIKKKMQRPIFISIYESFLYENKCWLYLLVLPQMTEKHSLYLIKQWAP